MIKGKGKTICVYSPKGGVGKSMIAANMASVSFLMDKKTLLIDADLYDGGLSLFVDNPIDKTGKKLQDRKSLWLIDKRIVDF